MIEFVLVGLLPFWVMCACATSEFFWFVFPCCAGKPFLLRLCEFLLLARLLCLVWFLAVWILTCGVCVAWFVAILLNLVLALMMDFPSVCWPALLVKPFSIYWGWWCQILVLCCMVGYCLIMPIVVLLCFTCWLVRLAYSNSGWVCGLCGWDDLNLILGYRI
jgi:hypothetical protein